MILFGGHLFLQLGHYGFICVALITHCQQNTWPHGVTALFVIYYEQMIQSIYYPDSYLAACILF
jgi:hypothetical protein